jgi:hypothetical protein
MNCNGQRVEKPYFQPTAKGKAVARSNGRELQVTFPVREIKYDAACNALELPTEPRTLTGTLKRKLAYVGRIDYIDKNGSAQSDMVLVKYYSH